MLDLLRAMALVGVAWIGLGLIFTGLGLAAARLVGKRTSGGFADLLHAFWTGWALAIVVLQMWHMALKIDAWPLLALAVGGVVGLTWNRRDLLALAGRLIQTRRVWPWLALLAVLSVWLANHAIDTVLNYDSGLYHFQAVRWNTTYRLVPGLGNLHGRLAFNSSYFLFVGLLDVGPWAGHAHNVAPGLLLLAVFARVLLGAYRLIGSKTWRWADLLAVLLFAPAFEVMIVDHRVSSPSPDVPVLLLGIVLALWLADFLDREGDLRALGQLVLLAAVGVTVKLSFVVFGAGCALLALGSWAWRNRQHRVRLVYGAGGMALLAALALVPWMVRGIILSGYPVYPSTIGNISAEWAVPREQAENEARWVRSWGRDDKVHWSAVLDNWNWFKPWAERVSGQDGLRIPLALVVAAAVALAKRRFYDRAPLAAPHWTWLVLLPTLPALVFWFFASPDLRFAGAAWWVLGLGSLAVALAAYNAREQAVTVALAVTLALIALNPVQVLNFVGPGDDGGFSAIPAAEVEQTESEHGVTIYVPVSGDQCWDAPLPCAPGERPQLAQRETGDWQAGFNTN